MISLIKNGKPNNIGNILSENEADIQRRIANLLESYGFDVFLELKARSVVIAKKFMKLDVVGFKDGVPAVVFEVKTPMKIYKISKHSLYQHMQMTHYMNNGLPAAFVSSVEEADDFIKKYVKVAS